VDDVMAGSSYLIEYFSGGGAVSGMMLRGGEGEAGGLGAAFNVVHAQTISDCSSSLLN
jgi:hypothetical protein